MQPISAGIVGGLLCSTAIIMFVILGVALCRVSGRASRVEESLQPAAVKTADDRAG